MKDFTSIEQKQLELDERRLQSEERIKDAELELRRKELEAKLEERKPSKLITLSSLSPTTIAAMVGILATLIGYLIQSNLNRELEKEKFQGQLVLKAIETGDPEKARTNLRFFVETGLLSDPQGKIRAALDRSDKKPELTPVLPVIGDQSARLMELRGVVVDDESDLPIAGATVQVNAYSLTALTTSEGIFSIDSPAEPGHMVLVRISKDGYLPSQQWVAVPGSPTIIRLRKTR